MKRDIEKRKLREGKELARRERQLNARNNRFYLIYLFMILALIYITDEIASTISIQFQTNIVTEFFVEKMGMEYGEGLSIFSGLGFITYPVTVLIVFYRPLADRFGRKPFLIVNTFCMGLGLFLIYLSENIYVYMVGSTLMSFMVSHDMQCVYILECSSEKNRARNYALVKAVAILGTLLIPLLRDTFMQNVSERWHLVYLVPALIGFLMSLFALVFARETNAFLVKRISYLKTPVEERERQSKEEKEANAQGGILLPGFVNTHAHVSMVPFRTMQHLYGLGNSVQSIGFTARRGHTVTALQPEVERVVRQAHLLAPDDGQALFVFNMEMMFQMIDSLFQGIEALVWLIGLGTLLSGAVGVSNIMMVTVRERTSEIGIRRAIGARPSSILWQVMAESIVLTVIAGLAGITFAVALLSGVEHIVAAQGETISFQVSFGLALGAAAALAVLGGLAGLAPSMRALSIRPIDAIRDE